MQRAETAPSRGTVPPKPPKPLHLTVRGRGRQEGRGGWGDTVQRSGTISGSLRDGDEDGDGGTIGGNEERTRGKGKGTKEKGRKYLGLPRWSVIEDGIDRGGREVTSGEDDGGDGAGKGKQENEEKLQDSEPTVQELLASTTGTTRRDLSESSNESFTSARGTMRPGGGGGSTIKVTSTVSNSKRRSIFFDPMQQNPLVKETSTASSSIDVDETETTRQTQTSEVENVEESIRPPDPEFASDPPRSPSPTSSRRSSSSNQLDLPLAPLLAISLHPFTGEPAFGELSFEKDVELCIEVDDLGGEWSLGYVKDIGEAGRGLIPRGWYKYVEKPSGEQEPSIVESQSAMEKRDGKINVDARASLKSQSPEGEEPEEPVTTTSTVDDIAAVPLPLSPVASSAPEIPSFPSSDPAPTSEETEAHSVLTSPSHEDEQPPTSPSYATKSIGRNVFSGGIEFEPIALEESLDDLGLAEYEGVQTEQTECEGENGEEEMLAEEARGTSETDGSRQTLSGAVETEGEEGPGKGSNELLVMESKIPLAGDPPEDETHTSQDKPVAQLASPSSSPTSSPSSRYKPTSSSEPTRSLLYRFAFGSSAASTMPSSLVGLSIPGASIIAASHPSSTRVSTLPEPIKRPRMSRQAKSMTSKEYVLEWIRTGDEFDENVDDEMQIWNIESGPTWKIESQPFVISVHSPRKVSPMGESPYTLFCISTLFPLTLDQTDPRRSSSSSTTESASTLIVYRRFSDFVSLHLILSSRFSLLSVPSLPPKAFGSTRFSEDFVEERRNEVERWLNKVSRHPVLRESEELRGFLSIEEDRDLRNLLAPQTNNAFPLFFARCFHPEFNVDLSDAIDIGERFERHIKAIELGGGIKTVESNVLGVREAVRVAANSLLSLSTSLIRLVSGTSLPPISYDPPRSEDSSDPDGENEIARMRRRAKEWRLQNDEGAMSWIEEDRQALSLAKAVQATVDALVSSSSSFDDCARSGLVEAQLLLQELARPATQHSMLLAVHRLAVSEYERLSRQAILERADSLDQLFRCETILNITTAQMDHIRSERTLGLKRAVEGLLDAQIRIHEESLDHLRFARDHYNAESFPALALTGPRLPSSRDSGHLVEPYSPLPVAQSFMVPQSTTTAVRGAIGSAFATRKTSTRRSGPMRETASLNEENESTNDGDRDTRAERTGSPTTWRESVMGTIRVW